MRQQSTVYSSSEVARFGQGLGPIGDFSAVHRQKIGSSAVRTYRPRRKPKGVGNDADRLEVQMRIIVILAAALSISTQAVAEPVPTALVNIGDIDFGSSAGQRVLGHRIARAVEQVCGSYANAIEPAEQSLVDTCRASAMASVNKQLESRSKAVQMAARTRR